MGLSRREFLRVGSAAGAFLVARPAGAFAGQLTGQPVPGDHFATSRASKLFPDSGRFVVHSDLHNHTLLSDGVASADDAFPQMRAAGLDVASLTDHAVMGKTHGDVTCNKLVDPQRPDTGQGTCSAYVGINETSWARLAELADASNDPGTYVAMRGFEWTTGSLGHLNVWFSQTWIDPLQTGSLTEIRDVGTLATTVGPPFPAELEPVVDQLPSTASIDGFYEWLAADPARPVLGGGADALAGFNHPNEYGDFNRFQYFGEVADRVVSCEVHNGPAVDGAVAYDYWFRGVSEGEPWPINACLNAGWRVGLLGVSDNHTGTPGRPDAARGGLWVRELSREGVREALLARRMFSTTVHGLRLDAALEGLPMGGEVPLSAGPARFEVDIDHGPDGYGRELVIEVAGAGSDEPVLLDAIPVQLGPRQAPVTFTTRLDPAETPWVLLRICDPEQPHDPHAVEGRWIQHGGAIAYSSPFYLTPGTGGGRPATASQTAPAPALPATGSGLAAAGATAALAAAAIRGGSRG